MVVGAREGCEVGAFVGACVTGAALGNCVGACVTGAVVGNAVGYFVGAFVGDGVTGAVVGNCVGYFVGAFVTGATVGFAVGCFVGDFVPVATDERRTQASAMQILSGALSHGVPSHTIITPSPTLKPPEHPPLYAHDNDAHAEVPSSSPRNPHSPDIAANQFCVCLHCSVCERQLPLWHEPAKPESGPLHAVPVIIT